MKGHKKKRATYANETSGLIVDQPLEHMVQEYQRALMLMDDGYKMVADAEALLNATFGGNFCTRRGDRLDDLKKVIRADAWRNLIDQLEMNKIMSLKRLEEIHKRLKDDDLPEITVDNIRNTFLDMVANADTFAQELVMEVYERLRPSNSKLKTNSPYQIGKKVIFRALDMMSMHYGNLHIDYQDADFIIAVDRVFHMLDGKTLVCERNTYQSPLLDAVKAALELSPEPLVGETEYFKFSAHVNCNLHLTFKRPDLVAKFNAIAGNASLKPNN